MKLPPSRSFIFATLPGCTLLLMTCLFAISDQHGYWSNVLYSTGTPRAPPYMHALRKHSPKDTIPFLIQQREIQEARRKLLKSACRKYYEQPPYDVINNPPWNLFLDTDHKILYCNIPKVACTSWKRVLLVLSGVIKHTDDMKQKTVNRYGKSKLTTLSNIPVKDRQDILDTYTKFMFVRHPFSRVLSAYKNKINVETATDKAGGWKVKRKMIAMEEGEADGVTFSKFLKYITTLQQHHRDDRHWQEATGMCLPCDINYDVIGKFETLSVDADYILQLTGVNHLVEFPSAEGSSPTNSSEESTLQESFGGVPLDVINSVYDKYFLDFQLFNYSMPKLSFFN